MGQATEYPYLDLQGIEEIESATEGLDSRLLDGPEQGSSVPDAASAQTSDLVQFFTPEDPGKGIRVIKLLGIGHINSNPGSPAEAGPHAAIGMAERDGGRWRPRPRKKGPAQAVLLQGGQSSV